MAQVRNIEIIMDKLKEQGLVLDDEYEATKYVYDEYYVKQYLSAIKIADLFGAHSSGIYKLFDKYNLPRRDDTEKGKLYSCNKDYFEIIDTEDKAYWLGFMYADGFIQSNGGGSRKIGLGLSVADIEHLEKFKKCLEYDGLIHIYKTGKTAYVEGLNYCKLVITEEKLASDLCDKGCVEHKTNMLKFPTEKQVPKELVRHFIRGYFDGDGSIYYMSDKEDKSKHSYGISFVGTEDMLTGILNQLITDKAILKKYSLRKRQPEHTIEYFNFGGNFNVRGFCEYIYQDATIYLDRKYQKYQELLTYIESTRKELIKRECDICGSVDNKEYYRWHRNDEYANMTVCGRHYRQLLKYGEITQIEELPKKNNICDICGDDSPGIYIIYNRDGQYKGKELCRKHYDQINKMGCTKDNVPAKHREVG